MVFTNHLFPTPVAVAQQMWTFIVSGKLLADMGKQAKLSDDEFAVFEQVRDKAPARPVSFEE